MRMSRLQWFGQFLRFPSGPRQARPKREKKEPSPLNVYTFDVPGHGRHTVRAHTKSEARAILKKLLKLPFGLPPGTHATRVIDTANVA